MNAYVAIALAIANNTHQRELDAKAPERASRVSLPSSPPPGWHGQFHPDSWRIVLSHRHPLGQDAYTPQVEILALVEPQPDVSSRLRRKLRKPGSEGRVPLR